MQYHWGASDQSARHLQNKTAFQNSPKKCFTYFNMFSQLCCQPLPCPAPILLNWATYSEIFFIASTWNDPNAVFFQFLSKSNQEWKCTKKSIKSYIPAQSRTHFPHNPLNAHHCFHWLSVISWILYFRRQY